MKPLPVLPDGPPLAVCVSGSRYWTDARAIHDDLAAIEATGRLWSVVEGDARGADRIAGRGWASKARHRGIGWLSVPADWATNGKAAGPIRNRQMIGYLRQCPDIGVTPIVLAYPLAEGRGTQDMIRASRGAGIRVLVRSA